MFDQLAPEIRYLLFGILLAHVVAGLGFCLYAVRKDNSIENRMMEMAKEKKE